VSGGPPGRAAVNLAVALLCLIWGSTWLVIREGLVDLPVFTSAAIRFTLAAALLAALAPALHRREGGRRPGAGLSLAMGVLNFGVSYAIVYRCEALIPSGLLAVLWAVFPMLVAALGHLLLRDERLSAGQGLGFLVAFVGVALLFSADLRQIGTEAVALGALFLLSPLAAAIGQTLVKRHGTQTSAVLLTRNGMIIGAVLLWALALPLEDPAAIDWTPRAVFSVLYLALLGTIVAFVLYYWLLRYAASNQMSLIAYVTPCIALLLGTLAGGEPLGPSTLAGTALVLCGIALARRRRA
jgi:drug/metabolite transporter (DMT)-like permease